MLLSSRFSWTRPASQHFVGVTSVHSPLPGSVTGTTTPIPGFLLDCSGFLPFPYLRMQLFLLSLPPKGPQAHLLASGLTVTKLVQPLCPPPLPPSCAVCFSSGFPGPEPLSPHSQRDRLKTSIVASHRPASWSTSIKSKLHPTRSSSSSLGFSSYVVLFNPPNNPLK